MNRSLKSLMAAAALCIVCAASAQAQSIANNTAFGDWIVACEALTVTENQCQLVQQQTRNDTQELAARFLILPAVDGAAIMLAQVPIGVYLPGGAVFGLEGDPIDAQQQMIWQRCLGPVCEAAILIDAATLESMFAAGSVLFGYRMDANAEPVILRLSVAQLDEGLAALRGDN